MELFEEETVVDLAPGLDRGFHGTCGFVSSSKTVHLCGAIGCCATAGSGTVRHTDGNYRYCRSA
jgi:hypothetical protein